MLNKEVCEKRTGDKSAKSEDKTEISTEWCTFYVDVLVSTELDLTWSSHSRLESRG